MNDMTPMLEALAKRFPGGVLVFDIAWSEPSVYCLLLHLMYNMDNDYL